MALSQCICSANDRPVTTCVAEAAGASVDVVRQLVAMNVVREIERINARELELNVPDSASWHAQYAHSAYIFIAALDNELTEGDVICIFSQFGEVVDCNLVRDRQSGKSRGFAFLAYEDQRSCVLAIDNMNGAKLLNRTLRVDHADRYRRPKEEERKAAGGRARRGRGVQAVRGRRTRATTSGGSAYGTTSDARHSPPHSAQEADDGRSKAGRHTDGSSQCHHILHGQQ